MATEARKPHEFRYDSQGAPDALVRDFLSTLEQEEARLLAWGVVDGGFTLEDVRERAETFLAENDTSGDVVPEGLVDTLLRRRLIFDLALDGKRLYRTRMAESVRLFSRLRQLFQAKTGVRDRISCRIFGLLYARECIQVATCLSNRHWRHGQMRES